jgi:hypothetical protein
MLAHRISATSLEWPGILVLVTAALLVGGLRPATAADGWLVREQPGTLQYRLPASAEWSRASPGMELQPGTTVRAGSGRPAVLTRADSSIAIHGGTELTLLPSTGTETVVQRLGRARYQVEPGSVSDFLVETPYLVIGIKGTVFAVLVNEAGTEVGVREGMVEVTTPDGRFRAELGPGQSARVGAAAGAALEVQSGAGGADAPAPADSAGSAPPDQTASPKAASPPTQAASSEAAPSSTQTLVGGALSALTSVTRSLDRLWSGIGGLLSDVDIVYDDRLPTHRRGTLVRTLRGGIASVGSGARGDSGAGGGAGASGGGGTSGGGSPSGAGGGGGSSSSGGSSSGGGGGGHNGSGSGGGGRGGGGLSGAVGGVSSSVGGAVGSVGSAIGGAVGGGLGSAVGGVGRGVGSAVSGVGKGLGNGLGGGRGRR